MLDGIECLGHSTIKMNKNEKIIYIDPYKIKENRNDADIIFITHNHYDHFSEEDIKKVKNDKTIIIVTEDLNMSAVKLGFDSRDIIIVKPDNTYKVNDIEFDTIPAYNINKKFHPKENNWVGYIININGIKYYIAGDTDITEENKKVECEVAFVPVGGTYTMDFEEAANLVNIIEPKIAIPIHYASIVGTKEDAKKFKDSLKPVIDCKIMIKID